MVKVVKREDPKDVDDAKLEAFISGADSEPEKLEKTPEKKPLDPGAKRDYKGIRVPFNEYEWEKLEALSNQLGRAKVNVIRRAILRWAEELETENGTKTD